MNDPVQNNPTPTTGDPVDYAPGRRHHLLHGRTVGLGATLALLAVLGAYALERYYSRKPSTTAPPPPPPGKMFDVREDAAATESRRAAEAAQAAEMARRQRQETA